MTARPITEGLEPCPFCGAQPEMESWHGGGPNKRMIKCWQTDCEVGPAVTGETPDEARAHWNRRSTSAAVRGMREQCAQLAFDQTSDDPAPGTWNDACEHIAKLIRDPALSGIETGNLRQARSPSALSAPISTDTKGTTK